MKKGIDAAKWQGTIEWDQVRAAGVEFAILKIIDKSCRVEEAFERNFAGAQAQYLPIGVYNYSYATTVIKAEADAQKVLEALKGRKLQCRIWLDVEDDSQQGLGQLLILIINAYKNIIDNAGYEFGVYTGLSFYNNHIRPYEGLTDCPFWIARYPGNQVMDINSNLAEDKRPIIRHTLWGWQFSSKGKIPGIRGSVDMNIMYEAEEENSKKAMTGNPFAEPLYNLYRHRAKMSAEHIRWMQFELNRMGYGLDVDGIWGRSTQEALKDAQRRLGIAVDGICGPDTRTRLKSTWHQIYEI